MAHLHGNEKRAYVARMFSSIVPRYDLMNTLMTLGQHHRWRAVTARRALSAPPGPALDLACGTGDLSLALAHLPHLSPIVALDLVPDMLKRARAKVRSRGLLHRIAPLRGDALHLPFPDDVFSVVASAFALRNLPDLEGGLAEMVRVLRPGGVLLSLEAFPAEGGPFRPLFRLYFNRIVPLVGGLVSGDFPAYRYLPDSVENFTTPEDLSHLLGGLGLEQVSFNRLALGTVAVHRAVKPQRP